MGGFAWVTLATNDSYSLGALVLAHSLKKSNTAHKLVVLITPSVSEPMREQLRTVFDIVKLVEVLDSKDEAHLALLKRPELGVTFTKIHCWRLTEFEKCVFLDADTLVVRNCDELFEREELSAAPDFSWPDCFNSGVFVFKPSIETFDKILQFAVEKGSFDGGDQGLLNQFFSDWATEDIKKHLPFTYNLSSFAAYSYVPAFKQYGSETRIVHFIGTGKPWLQKFEPASKTVTSPPGAEHLTPLLQKWWDLFCEHVHPKLDKNLSGIAGAIAQLNLESTEQSPALQEYVRRQNWETGNMDYMGKDSFDNIWAKICQTLEGKEGEESQPKQESQLSTEKPKTETQQVAQQKPETQQPAAQPKAETQQVAQQKPETQPPSEQPKAETQQTPQVAQQKPETQPPTVQPKSETPQVAQQKPETQQPAEQPKTEGNLVSLSSILQSPTSVPECIETLPSEPPPATTEEDEIIFTKPENRDKLLTNIAEEEESVKDQPSGILKTEGSAAPAPAVTPKQDPTKITSPSGDQKPEEKPTTPATGAVDNTKKDGSTTAPAAAGQELPKSTPESKATSGEGILAEKQIGLPAPPPTTTVPSATVPQPDDLKKNEVAPGAGDKLPMPPSSAADLKQQAAGIATLPTEATSATSKTEPPPATPDKKENDIPAVPKPSEAAAGQKPPSEASVKEPAVATAPAPAAPAETGKTENVPAAGDKNLPNVPTAVKTEITSGTPSMALMVVSDEPSNVQVLDLLKSKGDSKIPEAQTSKEEPEVKPPSVIPMPPVPDKVPELEKTSAEGQVPGKGNEKQKTGVLSKLLEMVGVSTKGKSDSEGSKSIFYDTETGIPATEVPKSAEQPQPAKQTEKPDETSATVKKELDTAQPGSTETLKPADVASAVPKEEAQKTPETGKPKEQTDVEKKVEEPKAKEEQKESESSESQKGKAIPKPARNKKNKKSEDPAPKDSSTIQISDVKRKSPSPKLTIPQKSDQTPETAVTMPTPPVVTDLPKEKDPSLLTVDETILETPPVTGGPGKSGKVLPEQIKAKSAVEDIIEKAKNEVESQLQAVEKLGAEKQIGGKVSREQDAGELINAMKLILGETEQNLSKALPKSEEIEELKVTTPEEREKHKGEVTSSKLSEQILKAIPPPRRKAISESKSETSSSTGAIPKSPTEEKVSKVVPQDSSKSSGESKPEEASKVSDVAKPSESGKPSDSSKPAESGKQTDGSKSSDSSKQSGNGKPAEGGKPSEGKPGKSSTLPVPPPRNKPKPSQPTTPHKGKGKK